MEEDDFYKQMVRQATINGENYINDITENKLMKKITVNEDWRAIKYRLDKKHLKYNTSTFPAMAPPPKVDKDVLLGLEDIEDEFNG
jgi:hypothetical protein